MCTKTKANQNDGRGSGRLPQQNRDVRGGLPSFRDAWGLADVTFGEEGTGQPDQGAGPGPSEVM